MNIRDQLEDLQDKLKTLRDEMDGVRIVLDSVSELRGLFGDLAELRELGDREAQKAKFKEIEEFVDNMNDEFDISEFTEAVQGCLDILE